MLLVVSSPSGAGKTTLCQRLMREHPRLHLSVSFTTRPPRRTEQDGVHYHFVDDATFTRMAEAGAFAEWAEVHGRRYGTGREVVDRHLAAGQDLLFDIDWQGALQLRDQYPTETELIFVIPPTMAALERRLRGRGTDAEEVIQLRLRNARQELQRSAAYHHILENDDLELAYQQLRRIYLTAPLAGRRQAGRVRALLQEGQG